MNSESTFSLQLIWRWWQREALNQIFTRIFKSKWGEGIEWRSTTALLTFQFSALSTSVCETADPFHLRVLRSKMKKWKKKTDCKYLPSRHFNALLYCELDVRSRRLWLYMYVWVWDGYQTSIVFECRPKCVHSAEYQKTVKYQNLASNVWFLFTYHMIRYVLI